MLGRRIKAAVLGVALLVLAVEGVLLVRHYDRYYGSDAASGNAASSAPASERTMPEWTAPGATASTGDAAEREEAAARQDQAAADRSAEAAQRAEGEYLDALENIQTNAVETFRNSHEKLLRYDALAADDVQEMKANEVVLQGMAERADNLDPPEKYAEQHEVFVSAIDQLHEAVRLAHAMADDPVAAAELGFDEYDDHVNKASVLLRQSNELLGEDHATLEGVREVSPEF